MTTDDLGMQVLARLESDGPATAGELMRATSIRSQRKFRHVLLRARTLATEIGLMIPTPVATDGYCYRLTGDWIANDGDDVAIRDSAQARVTDELSRARTTQQHLTVAYANTDKRSRDGKALHRLIDISTGYVASLEVLLDSLEVS